MAAAEGNLILGTACNLQIADVHIFIESLRRYYRGEVLMLVTSRESADLVRYLRSRRVIPVWFDCTYWMVMQVQLGRYVRYGEILRNLPREYSRVLLTDVSDVVFQADPFAEIPDDELLCFLETPGRTIGECVVNTMWVEQIFGSGGLERIKDYEISCSGTTIGSHRAMIHYIDLLLEHAEPNLLVRLLKFRGHDQGIHNFLLRTGALPKARLIPNGQHVFTVGAAPESEISLGPGGTILAPGARLCPIVHQYTTKPAALAHVRSAYALPKA